MNRLNILGSKYKQLSLLGICLLFPFLLANCSPDMQDTQADLLSSTPNRLAPNVGPTDKIGSTEVNGGDAGGTIGSAEDISQTTLASGSVVVEGSIGYNEDYYDYYFFRPTLDRKIKISLTRLTQNNDSRHNGGTYLRIYRNGERINQCKSPSYTYCGQPNDKFFPGNPLHNVKSTARDNVVENNANTDDDNEFKVEVGNAYAIGIDPWSNAYSAYKLELKFTTNEQQSNDGTCLADDEIEARDAGGIVCDDITNTVKIRNCHALDFAPIPNPDGRLSLADSNALIQVGMGTQEMTYQKLKDRGWIEKVEIALRILETFNLSNNSEEGGFIKSWAPALLTKIYMGINCVPETEVIALEEDVGD